MAGGTGHIELSSKRRELTAKQGAGALFASGRTFAICLFASLGGLVYGCMSLPSFTVLSFNQL